MGKMNVVISDKTEKQFRRTTPIHKGFKKREEDSLNSICLTFGIVGGRINLSSLGGSQQSVPFVTVSMQVESQPAFNTQMAIGNTNLNLLQRGSLTFLLRQPRLDITAKGYRWCCRRR